VQSIPIAPNVMVILNMLKRVITYKREEGKGGDHER
ncbi:unnamed protein product, partial [marine sediment metagenome]